MRSSQLDWGHNTRRSWTWSGNPLVARRPLHLLHHYHLRLWYGARLHEHAYCVYSQKQTVDTYCNWMALWPPDTLTEERVLGELPQNSWWHWLDRWRRVRKKFRDGWQHSQKEVVLPSGCKCVKWNQWWTALALDRYDRLLIAINISYLLQYGVIMLVKVIGHTAKT